MKSLKADWESYLNQIVPKNAGPVQKRETKQAFYAGAWAFFSIISIGSSEDMIRAKDELVEFYKQAERDAIVEQILRSMKSEGKPQ